LRTWIRRAAAAGARILVDTEVSRVLVREGAVWGVEGVHAPAEGPAVPVRIRARRVVVAAGSIHTPALLLRSGLSHPHLGRHLYLHPTVPVAGFYEDDMVPWWGVMMSTVNDELAHQDGGYGCKIETPPVHTGLLGLATPWTSARQHKESMLDGRRSGNFIVLTRDRFGGRVTVDRQGRPEVRYRLHRYDRKHLLRGIEECVRIHLAAGARSTYVPHSTFPRIEAGASDAQVQAFLEGLRRLPWKSGTFQLFTAHQMGTCRMGGSPKKAPVSPEGEVYGVKNLFVADASAFPAASGVNPMTSIQTLAYHTIQGLITRL
jgi:choline dehydrogenase-like flavoprotein